jgi:hypothetical protein
MAKKKADLLAALTSRPIRGRMLISRRSSADDPLVQTLNETIRQVHAEGRTMFQSPTATTSSNSTDSRGQENSPQTSTGSPTPHLDAAWPLTEADREISRKEAEVALANLRRNSLAAKNLN